MRFKSGKMTSDSVIGPSPHPDHEAAHGPARNGCCPRCGTAVRVVGYESCDCGREHIEQLAPAMPTDTDLISLGESAVRGYLDFPAARAWFTTWVRRGLSQQGAKE